MDKEKIPKQSGEIPRREKGEVSRRDFLIGAGAVVVGGAVGAGITYPLVAGKEGEVTTKTIEVTKTVEVPGPTVTTTVAAETVTTTTTVGAETVTSTVPGPTKTVTTTLPGDGVVEPAFEPEETFVESLGWMAHAANGSLAHIDTKNGRVVRIRPLHYDEKFTKEHLNPWKLEARGKVFEVPLKSLPAPLGLAYKKRVYSPNRILYPLKRVDWEPGGDPAKINPQNRGKSKFKRISWDEAIETVASEIKRVQDTYGPEALCPKCGNHGANKVIHGIHGIHHRLIRNDYTAAIRNPDSWEGWYWGAQHTWGMDAPHGGTAGMPDTTNITIDVARNSDMILFIGFDEETTPWVTTGQLASLLSYWMSDLGIKQVRLTPDLNYGGAVHADKWIPLLAGMDAALFLGIAYVWMTEGMYDKEYVATHTFAFDKFEDYVLGNEAGDPEGAKTPTWASLRCGVPVWTIKALARQWAQNTTAIMGGMGPGMRVPYSTEAARLQVYCMAMQAIGKPGTNMGKFGGLPGPEHGIHLQAVMRGDFQDSGLATVKQCFMETQIHHAILNPPVHFYGGSAGRPSHMLPVEVQWDRHDYPEEGCSEVHMYWNDGASFLTRWSDGNRMIEAYRSPKLEFILIESPYMEGDCLYSDIILPVTSKFEDNDIAPGGGEFSSIVLEPPQIEHLGESMSDYELVGEIGKKLEKYGGRYEGMYETYTEGKSVEEWIKIAYERSGAADQVSWEELNEKGYYIIPTRPDYKEKLDEPAGIYGFYSDPVKNPVHTKSGLIEFYSQWLMENFPDDRERPGTARWIVGGPGWTHDESLWGERCKKYPLTLVSNHPHWREHASHDDSTWLREIPTCKVRGYDGYMYEPLWINPTDAAERGIETGDIVKIYNDRGIVLRGAYVTERIVAGSVGVDSGARPDPIADRIDRGGADNIISPGMGTSQNAWGMVCAGFLVEVAKVTGDEMEEWRKKYPEAFARDYDPASGQRFSGWVEGGI